MQSVELDDNVLAEVYDDSEIKKLSNEFKNFNYLTNLMLEEM